MFINQSIFNVKNQHVSIVNINSNSVIKAISMDVTTCYIRTKEVSAATARSSKVASFQC